MAKIKRLLTDKQYENLSEAIEEFVNPDLPKVDYPKGFEPKDWDSDAR